jgi:hypothetical protein
MLASDATDADAARAAGNFVARKKRALHMRDNKLEVVPAALK